MSRFLSLLLLLVGIVSTSAATDCYKVSAPSNSALCNAADYQMEVCDEDKGAAEDLVQTMAILGDGNLNLDQCREIVKPYCEVVGGTVKPEIKCDTVCFMMNSGALIACDVRGPGCDVEESVPDFQELLTNWRSFFNEALAYMCCSWVTAALEANCQDIDPEKLAVLDTLQIELLGNRTESFCTNTAGCFGASADGETPDVGQGDGSSGAGRGSVAAPMLSVALGAWVLLRSAVSW